MNTIETMLACYHTGRAMYARKRYEEAADLFLKASELQPTFFEAWYNLALTYKKLTKFEKSQTAFQKAHEINPNNEGVRFHLGCLFMQSGHYDAALLHFLKIIETWSSHPESLVNLANCYMKQGKLDQAKQYYERAQLILPEDTQILFNLGVVYTQIGNSDRAIQCYQKVIQFSPRDFSAHYNLALLFLEKSQPALAMKQLKQAQLINPKHVTVNYLIEALKNNPELTAAPSAHLANLFDGYADHYEAHLLQALDYAIPKIFLHTFIAISYAQKNLRILDLGCGTGLCGAEFRSFAEYLVGVDLSEKMLEKARDKKCYDQLIQAHLENFLKDNQTPYDLILAGDVLVYIGCLKHLFKQIKKALHPHGLFIFNTEINEEKNYDVRISGRFAHSLSYLKQLAADNHLALISCEVFTTRLQNNLPVENYICVVK